MGKRLRRGGRSPSVMDRAVLRRRIVSSNLEQTFDSKSVAIELQDRYPDYRRCQRQPLILHVEKALEFLQRNNSSSKSNTAASSSEENDSSDGGDDGPPSRRPLSRAELSEQRLARKESEHLRRFRSRLASPVHISEHQSAHKESPGQGDPSSSSSDDSTSTSEDAAFEAKFEPEFDVTKSILRDVYAKQSKKPAAVKGKEDNMEIETGIDKPTRTMELASRNSDLVQTSVTRHGGSGEGGVGREGPRFCDLGGMQGVLEELMMDVIVPLCHPQLPRWLGVRPMAGILLHGPPGCGKTKLAHAIANETGVPFYKISATEVVSGVSGASEENIRELFKKAYRTAPSIVFIDEIDAIASKRENLQREMERRIVTQLMICMDELHQTLRTVDSDKDTEGSERKPGYVLVIGATNRPDAVDHALRRPGRFDREIVLGVPDENARAQILSVFTRNLRFEGKFNLFKIARSTPGFVGADLAALVNKAGNLAMKRIIDRRRAEFSSEHKDKNTDWWRQPWTPDEIEGLSVTMVDLEEALKIVQPSSKREGFSSIPNVTWEDVGGLNSLRKEFDRYIVQRIKFPELYKELGVKLEAGILLYGPPGCGKTLIAKAVANDSGASFIHIKAAEILNKYVGESELAVRTIFSHARTCSPCILFFDEVDALTTMRGKEGGWVVERLLNQLLIELDGGDQRQGVYVIGATNRFDVIDPALLRPGRLGKVLYVPLPNVDERGLILKALTRKMPIGADVDLDVIGRREACNNLTGADLSLLVEESAMAAFEEKQASLVHGSSSTEPLVIKASHFEKALEKITHSVSEKQRSFYDVMSRTRTAA